MNINPANAALPTTAATKVNQVNAGKAYGIDQPAATTNTRAADRLELSGATHLLAKSNDIRADKVADLKAQIANGTYDLDAKADAVADRLIDDLGL
ncbi:MAG: flagellar biosynthesis anti-sigma factor FlgM [Planctomycetota bacterium]